MQLEKRQARERKKRAYKHRVNNGGNFCGHNRDAPRLKLAAPTTDKKRPGILIELQERITQYYRLPSRIGSLNAANKSKRQQRSERREACILLLVAILEHTDLTSLRCGIPTAKGFLSLTLPYLIKQTGLGQRRAERALKDLQTANLLSSSQPRQLKEDGTFKGLASIKAVNKLLFMAFGLGRRLVHERKRASERLAKKVKRAGGTLTGWARNALAIQGAVGVTPSRRRTQQKGDTPDGIDRETYLKARSALNLELYTLHPEWTRERREQELDMLLASRLSA